MPSGPVFCLADEGETYAVDESVATCSLEQTNDAAYWISQATFISKDSHMSIDCAHVCETDWMYIRYDDPKKQAMFNGIFSCMNSSNLKRPRWWARWCFRPSRDKNNSALGANAKQTLDSFISSLTLLYFIDLYCASYFYVQYSSHMYDFSFFFFQLFCVLCARCHVFSSLHKGFAFVWVPYWWSWEWPVWPVFVRNLRYLRSLIWYYDMIRSLFVFQVLGMCRFWTCVKHKNRHDAMIR